MDQFVVTVSYLKLLSTPLSLIAAVSGIWAAVRWLQASQMTLPPFDPPIASMSDAPELHILDVSVRQNEAFRVLGQSSDINAQAARWTALAAFLTALVVLLGII